MANLTANPWSFTSTDAASTAAITSIVSNGASALLTTTSAHGLTGTPYISVQGASPSGWNGGYRVEAVPSTTTLLLRNQGFRMALANAGAAGNIYTVAYPFIIEVTQMIWDGATTGSLSITDLSGAVVWAPAIVATYTGSGFLSYMKAFPINGLVLNTLGSGTLQISV